MPWSFSDMYGRQKIVDANVFPIMVPIYDTSLTGAQATIDIQNISQAYTHLVLKIAARGDTAATVTQIYMKLNNDGTSGNYGSSQLVYSNSTSASAAQNAATSAGGWISELSAASNTAGRPSVTEVQIMNYTGTTYHKAWTADGYTPGAARIASGGLWLSTAAVTQITLTPAAGNFAAGTRVTLYGIGVVAPSAPGSVVPVTYGTSLPSSPLNGQEAILVDNVSTPTYQWRFRYNANSANTDKWEFIGGPPLEASVNDATLETLTSSASYTDFTTNASLVCPRTGQYKIEFGVTVAPPSGPGNDLYVVSTVSAGDNDAIFTTAQASAASQYVTLSKSIGQKAIAAGATVKLQYKTNTGNGNSRRSKYVRIIPVRVS